MHPVYELLASEGMTPKKFARRLLSWPSHRIMNFLIEAYFKVESAQDAVGAPYAFLANSSLSGDYAAGCFSSECVLGRVDSTARFAALYADKVVIHNPFQSYYGAGVVNASLVGNLAVTIQVLHAIRPAVEAGLIGFAPCHFVLCEEHSKELVYDVEAKLEPARELLENEYAENVSVQFKRSACPGYWEYHITGPDPFVEHEHFVLMTDSPPSDIVDKLNQDGVYQFHRDEIYQHGFPRRFAGEIVEDLLVHNAYGTREFHYLTDRELDSLAASALNDQATESRSAALFAGLRHSLPVLPDTPLSKLVKLRQTEGEAFRVYRDKLNGVLGELASERELNEERVQQAFRDAIEPELNRIDLAIRTNRRLLAESLRENIVFGTGLLAVGLVTGFASPELGKLLACVGGPSFVLNALSKANALCKEPKEVRENSCYFLWKAKQQPNRRHPALR